MRKTATKIKLQQQLGSKKGRKIRERNGGKQGQRRETVLNHIVVLSSYVRSDLQ